MLSFALGAAVVAGCLVVLSSSVVVVVLLRSFLSLRSFDAEAADGALVVSAWSSLAWALAISWSTFSATIDGISRQKAFIGSCKFSQRCLKPDECDLSPANDDSVILLMSEAGFSTVVVFFAVVEPSLLVISLVSVVALAVGLHEVVAAALLGLALVGAALELGFLVVLAAAGFLVAGLVTVVDFLAVVEPSLLLTSFVTVLALVVGLVELAAVVVAGLLVVALAEVVAGLLVVVVVVFESAGFSVVGLAVVVDEVILVLERVTFVGFPSALVSELTVCTVNGLLGLSSSFDTFVVVTFLPPFPLGFFSTVVLTASFFGAAVVLPVSVCSLIASAMACLFFLSETLLTVEPLTIRSWEPFLASSFVSTTVVAFDFPSSPDELSLDGAGVDSAAAGAAVDNSSARLDFGLEVVVVAAASRANLLKPTIPLPETVE